MNHDPPIHVTLEGTTHLVRFTADDLNDAEVSRQIALQVDRLLGELADTDQSQLKIDFAHIDRLSSAGLNGLIGINSHARGHGVRLVLLDVQPAIREVFALTRLERLFDFSGTSIGV